jgi:hypothetical protein
MPRSPLPRAMRGLLLGFTLSVTNLAGAFLVILALGGLGEWTSVQFIGLFGLMEVATGLAFVVCPNIWRLPVAEANTSGPTPVRLAASTLLLPHWAAGTKTLAGAVFLVAVAVHEGVGMATAGVLLLVLGILVIVLSVSLIIARLGVARPDLDVFFIKVRRPGHKEHELPGISVGASIVQVLLNLGPYPAVRAFAPTALYRPELGPSATALVWCLGTAGVLAYLAALVWRGRFTWRAAHEQQREAEKYA